MIMSGKPVIRIILGVAALVVPAAALVVVFDPTLIRDVPIIGRDKTAASGAAIPAAEAPGQSASVPTAEQAPSAADHGRGASPLATMQQQASGLAAALGPLVPQSGAESDGPAFDVVNVAPSGDAVVAGRAAPGATVELLRNGEVHDRVVADRAGQFAMVPPRLPAGTYDLTLRSKLADGHEVTSKQSVAVNVEAGRQQATVALLSPDEPTRVLSKPAGVIPQALAVDAVDHETNGVLRVNGRARPGATVRLYLNDRLISSTVAGADGRLSIAIGKDVSRAGNERIRLDEVDPASGSVQARAEVPLSLPDDATTASLSSAVAGTETAKARAATQSTLVAAAGNPREAIVPAARGEPKMTTVTVARGDSLWHISRRLLGGGTRYAVIYKANREQIRSPDLIYPGQVFMLPARR
ncbi:LysM peptidoglycan-binding domain-containing protein [Bradyrhizobium oligotrophicum]|uniref:LysM peptidoglycan-binding domain-containing protein n=1 Tax=Bradyrhizobium TaxID=374 RepID=UPI003EBD3E9D